MISIPQKKKKIPEVCSSCEYLNSHELTPNCSKSIDFSTFTANNKECADYDLKGEFVERFFHVDLPQSINPAEVKCEYTGISNSPLYNEKNVWNPEYSKEIDNAVMAISQILKEKGNSIEKDIIASIDIETTNYIPMAREGYVNHICQTILNLTETTPSIDGYQIINMNRKPGNVGLMLQKTWRFMNERNISDKKTTPKSKNVQFPKKQLVFNAAFDIKILQKCIEDFGLDLTFPSEIIDLMRNFKSLAILEEWLFPKAGFKRIITEKGHYDEYYTNFKKTKQIEPISTYNFIDTLTPLIAFLVLKENL